MQRQTQVSDMRIHRYQLPFLLVAAVLAACSRPETPQEPALAAVQQWLQSGRYAVIEPNLRQISARLTTFIRDATAAQPTNPPGNSGR